MLILSVLLNFAAAIINAYGWFHLGFADLALFASGLNVGVMLMCGVALAYEASHD